MHPVGCLKGSAVGACSGQIIAHNGFVCSGRGSTPTSAVKADTGATAGLLIPERQEGKEAVSLEPYPLTPLEVRSTIYLLCEGILLQGFVLQF
jgi:hypothetical protein